MDDGICTALLEPSECTHACMHPADGILHQNDRKNASLPQKAQENSPLPMTSRRLTSNTGQPANACMHGMHAYREPQTDWLVGRRSNLFCFCLALLYFFTLTFDCNDSCTLSMTFECVKILHHLCVVRTNAPCGRFVRTPDPKR